MCVILVDVDVVWMETEGKKKEKEMGGVNKIDADVGMYGHKKSDLLH